MDENLSIIGEHEHWGSMRPLGISHADRGRHLYVLGKTGSGKSTLLRNLIIQDINLGKGVAVIDPHGDFAESLLDCIPPRRIRDVVYFNPADVRHPFALNLLAHVPRDERHLKASAIVSAFKSIWRDSWGPRLEYILYVSIASLLECKNTSLLGIRRLLSDRAYRDWVIGQIDDPMLRDFWLTEFSSYAGNFATEAISPILNKIGPLLMAPVVRNIVGQVRCSVDFRFMMDTDRIFIANLSKGRLGFETSNLLGALLTHSFFHAAMSRADCPEDERRDFLLYADEFPNFVSDSFADMLSEARKYRLFLTLSHQYIEQLRAQPRVLEAVFGNVGSILSFRVGNVDAERLSREFGEHFPPARFTDLPNFEFCAKLADRQIGAVVGRTLPGIEGAHRRGEEVISYSRTWYAERRKVVEAKIQRWLSGNLGEEKRLRADGPDNDRYYMATTL